ncbi:hypothetical protein [Streptomyces sp. NPDC050704]|uniref:hypothetical protein n=1 Tax=Streptomyces sp. NPDC050704 TaxID=3157219 RepID=UPI003445C4FE
MTAPPAPPIADEYPVRDVRFVNGRTRHRTKRPDGEQWWELLEAACGKTGYLCTGYTAGAVRDCRGCVRATGGQTSNHDTEGTR